MEVGKSESAGLPVRAAGQTPPKLHFRFGKNSTAGLYFSCIKQAKSRSGHIAHPRQVCSDPPVAMLVFLSRTAGAGGVARRARIDAGSARAIADRRAARAEAAGRGQRRAGGS